MSRISNDLNAMGQLNEEMEADAQRYDFSFSFSFPISFPFSSNSINSFLSSDRYTRFFFGVEDFLWLFLTFSYELFSLFFYYKIDNGMKCTN
jgi:hypothetical protein